jgi:hypothetical protein
MGVPRGIDLFVIPVLEVGISTRQVAQRKNAVAQVNAIRPAASINETGIVSVARRPTAVPAATPTVKGKSPR